MAFPEAGLVQDDGVFVADDFRNYSPPEQAFDWTPAYDMDWPGAPNPITAPALPIPFTAGELAAFMLDGMGAGLQEYLDRRIGCPLDDEALKRFGKRGRLVREALRSAYALAEQAQSVVGEFDYKKQKRAYDKRSQLETANEQASSSDEAHHGRAVASTAKLRARVLKASAESDARWIAWRAAMVRQLLQPKPQAMMPPSVAPLEERSAPGDEPLQPVPAPKAETPSPEPVVAEIDYSMLATPEKLIEAFGQFTGMDRFWFNKLADKPELLAARAVEGKRGRGGYAPLFYPFTVMSWLIDQKRKTGKPISEATAWRMLKAHFPKVHAAHSDYDPNNA